MADRTPHRRLTPQWAGLSQTFRVERQQPGQQFVQQHSQRIDPPWPQMSFPAGEFLILLRDFRHRQPRKSIVAGQVPLVWWEGNIPNEALRFPLASTAP